jgi:hypothetical protein
MTDAGIPMPALVFWMPMPSYGYLFVNRSKRDSIKVEISIINIYCTSILDLCLNCITVKGTVLRKNLYFWATFLRRLSVQHICTTAFQPQSNGMVQRNHLKEALKARMAGPQWTTLLPWVMLKASMPRLARTSLTIWAHPMSYQVNREIT